MANPKRAKMNEYLKKLPRAKAGAKDLLSSDLATKVGLLAEEAGDFLEKEKITIRLDSRVLAAAKEESKRLGVGYQKILNDRLLAVYGIREEAYLGIHPVESLAKVMEDLEQRIEERLEKRINKIIDNKRA